MERQAGYLDPMCPRCGYDQSGEAATWEGACPVTGTCPECGHGFGWADLYTPSRMDLAWHVEHASGLRSFLWRSFRTLGVACVPWVFWRRMDVDRRVRPWVLLGWITCVFVVFHAVASGIIGLLIAAQNAVGGGTVSDVFRAVFELPLQQLNFVVINGLIWPAASVHLRWGWTEDPQPESILVYSLPIGFGVMWVILMVVLPTTRRLAKLRFAHIWRAFAIHCGMVILCIQTLRALHYSSYYFWNAGLEWFMLACYFLTLIWSVVWWTCAIRVGWQIKSWAMLLSGMVAAILGTPVVFFPIGMLIQAVNP